MDTYIKRIMKELDKSIDISMPGDYNCVKESLEEAYKVGFKAGLLHYHEHPVEALEVISDL